MSARQKARSVRRAKTKEPRPVATDRGQVQLLVVPGGKPYVWLGDQHGNYLDSIDLSPVAEGCCAMNECEVCGSQIQTMCFLGTGVCSESCRKQLSIDLSGGAA